MIYWGGEFDFSAKRNELLKLKTESTNPEIWKDDNAKSIFQKIKHIEKKINDFESIKENLEYIEDLFNIAIYENNEESSENDNVTSLEQDLEDLNLNHLSLNEHKVLLENLRNQSDMLNNLIKKNQ